MAYESSDRQTSTYRARVALLDAVVEVKPAALEELRELVPRFREATHYLQRRYGDRVDLWEWHIMKSRRPEPGVLQLRLALMSWGQKHNLIFNWCIECAIYSLSSWASNIKSFDYGWAFHGQGYTVPIVEEEARFILELPGWRPDLEGQEAFTKRANSAYKQHVKAYITRIKTLLHQRKQVESKRKYKPLVDEYDDFKLLAMKLVCGLGYKDILAKIVAAQKRAKSKNEASYNALESRIRRTAELCGIDPELLKQSNPSKNQKFCI